jgi:hypothetical protein
LTLNGPTWSDTPETFLALAACDLDGGGPPRPRLAAHRGEEPLALATLRPFDDGEVLAPVIELLALLVPLGADRVGFAFPCRVWSLHDPIPPVLEEEGIDLRQPAVVVGMADGHQGPCRTAATVHPFDHHEDGGWGWGEALGHGEAPDAPLLCALETILDARGELATDPGQLQAQFDRLLLLGHRLTLGPVAARQLPSSPFARMVDGPTQG